MGRGPCRAEVGLYAHPLQPSRCSLVNATRAPYWEGASMGASQGKKAVPHGKKGDQIFAEVERLTAGGAMKRLAAFEQIAKKSGGQPGTVAANYYRIARKRGGAGLRPRRTGGKPQSASTRGALGALAAALKQIGAVLDAQEAELAALRRENRRFAELRRLLR